MAVEKLFRDALLADATVSGLVGNRVFTLDAEQVSAVPYIVLQLVSERRQPSTTSVDSCPQARLQVDVIGADMPSVATVRDAVRRRMDNYSGGDILSSRLITQFDAFDPDIERPRTVAEYRVRYSET